MVFFPKMRIQFKILLVMSAIILMTTLTFSTIIYNTQKESLLQGIDAKLLTTAQFASALLSEEYHDRIIDQHSVSDDEYLSIVDTYNQLCLELNLQYIWSVMIIDDQIVFTSATSPGKEVTKGDHASFFDVHTNPDVFKETFSAMKIQYTSFHNKWGHGRMVLVPANDSKGRPYCFGASISINDVNVMVKNTLLNSIMISAGVLLAGILVSVLLANSLSTPIRRITRIAKNIANGNLNQTIEVTGSAELESLSRSMNEMSTAIREKITELQNSREHLNITLHSIGDAVIATDTGGYITRMNPMAEKFTGWTSSDAQGQPLAEVFHIIDSDTRETAANPVEKVLRLGEVVGLGNHTVLISKDSTERQIADSGAPIRNREGHIVGVVLVFRNITAEYEKDRQLQESERRLSTLMSNLPGMAYRCRNDKNRTMEFISEGSIALIGYAPSDLIGNPTAAYRDLIHPDDQNAVWGQIQKVLKQREPFIQEYRMRTASGEEKWVWEKGMGIFSNDGELLALEGFISDITERRRAEEEVKKHRDHLKELVAERTEELTLAKNAAEAANLAKSKFLANMSHELRTPLNAILGYTQVLQRDPSATEFQHDRLHIIQQSGEHLLTLLNDILDLSKIEAGRMELHPAEFHLADFLKMLTENIRIQAAQKQLRFNYDPSPDVPAAVQGDEIRLRQVLINLLGNAVKYTEKGSVALKVTQVKRDNLQFEIKDTGHGIPPDELEQIFSPFRQAGRHAGKAGGVGLGLAISKRFVEMMGGELGVESSVGQGTRFWVEIPLPAVDSWTAATQRELSPIIGYTGQRRTILVVDDNPVNRAVLLDVLVPLGFEVVEADSGREGVAQAKACHPDLILMDLVMPDLDDFEATKRIRNEELGMRTEEWTRPVIVAISASVFDMDQQRSVDAGCDDFIPKPFKADEVLNTLQRHLGLEWIFAESTPLAEDAEATPVPMILPPPDAVDTLLEFARLGDISAIRHQAEALMQRDPRLKPFATELLQMAKEFRIDKIRTWLIVYHRGEK